MTGDLVPVEDEDSEAPKQLELFERSLDLERQRLDIQDRRTEVVSEAIRAADEAHKREHEFHMERLRSADADRARRFSFGKQIAMGTGAFATVLIAVLIYMVFWGSEQQSQTA